MSQQTNFNRQMNQLKYRVRITPGYKYAQLGSAGPFTPTRRRLFAVFLAVLIFAAIVTIYYLSLQRRNRNDSKYSTYRHYNHGSVVANGKECAAIGSRILQNGGSVADAAVSTVLCEGVTCPQSSGLGGGFLMTIYIKEKNTVECLDSREIAPLAASKNMFVNKSSNAKPGLLVAVPSELKGLWELHKKYGKLEWSDLIKPVIELCREGHEVTEYLARVLQTKKQEILGNPSLRQIFVNSQNDVLKYGDKIKRPKLADTLEKISINGADIFYEGEIGKTIVEDVEKEGGILSEIDMKSYKVRWLKPLVMNLTNSGEKLYTVPLSGSGAILIFILNVLKGFTLKHDTLSYHRIIETFKFAFSNKAELGDAAFSTRVEELQRNLTTLEYAEHFRSKIDDAKTHELPFYISGNVSTLPEDHGTAHIAILAPNGDAISVTSTINNIFGSMIRSRTGIILNDEMNDFTFTTLPGQSYFEANFISPGKRPISSMMPSIVLDSDGHVKMIVGSAGGPKIITSVAQALISRFLMNSTAHHNLENIFALKRLHHQLNPNIIKFEEGFDHEIIEGLQNLNHTIEKVKELIGFGALVGISIENDEIVSAFDPRRGGSRNNF